jgi:hypothetical protein
MQRRTPDGHGEKQKAGKQKAEIGISLTTDGDR